MCTEKRLFGQNLLTRTQNWPKNIKNSLKELTSSFSGFKGLAVLIFGLVVFGQGLKAENANILGIKEVLGGPTEDVSVVLAKEDPFLIKETTGFSSISFNYGSVLGFSGPIFSSDEQQESQENFLTDLSVISHLVKDGETVESLAKSFSIDMETILWANNLESLEIEPGDRLLILPVSGVLHQVSDGETVESLAKNYEVSQDRITMINRLKNGEQLMAGEKLIIPGGIKKQKLSFNAGKSSGSGFRMPTTGINWGKLHAFNAVDIANDCGTPVFASKAGFVKKVDDSGWNSGYGNFISLNHKNNLETLYAHLSAVFVSEGAYVDQGDLIGAIGNTGKVDGTTGCHLHFEVHGAENPFVR